MDPSLYCAIRFSICAIIFSPNIIKALSNKDLFLKGLLVGSAVSVGYVGQANGLMTSSAGTAAFIASLSTIWLAFVESFMNRKFKLQTWASCFLAVLGTALLDLQNFDSIVGNAWLALMPVGFGSGYMLLSSLVKNYPDDADQITGMKLGSAAVICTLWAASEGHTIEELPTI